MIGGGAAVLHPNHWLAQVGKEFLPAPVTGRIQINYHFLEYIFMDLLLLSPAVMDLGQGWYFSYPLLSQVMAELAFVKIPIGSMSSFEIRELITKWGKENLSIAQRTVNINGVIQDPN